MDSTYNNNGIVDDANVAVIASIAAPHIIWIIVVLLNR